MKTLSIATVLSLFQISTSKIFRQAICDFNQTFTDFKQDIHNRNITFSTAGQQWMNSGTRAEGTSIEPVFDDLGKSTAKVVIARRNPPDHVFFIQSYYE